MISAPRFTGRSPSSGLASRIKRQNRARDTVAELALRRAIWRRGLRYRLYDSQLPGKPDLVFPSARVVVFVDGDFWHGRNWAARRKKLQRGANAPYWIAKIATNMTRDRRHRARLRRAGWVVIRVWETDVLRDAEGLADTIEVTVRSRKG